MTARARMIATVFMLVVGHHCERRTAQWTPSDHRCMNLARPWSEGWGTNTHLRCWVAPVLLQWMTEGFYRVQEEREEAACNRKGVCACDVIGCLQRSSVSCGACCANSRSKFSTVFHRVKRSTEQEKESQVMYCVKVSWWLLLCLFLYFFFSLFTQLRNNGEHFWMQWM